MRDQITSRLQGFQRTFASFSAGQKTTAVIGGLALVLAAFMVFRWAATPSYAPLYSNLAPADASAVIDKLDAAGTPYKITGGGDTIMVPQKDVYSARIQLSGDGLPSSSSTAGYSLLDGQSLSTSQFQEQTSYKRAIEGELEKTIEALDAVDTAVVHVAMPQEKLFQTDQQPTTASVLVATHPGVTLSTEQVQAIVHLVASSVEGLDPKQVTVTDSAGNVLSTAGDGIDSVASTRDQEVKAFEDRMSGSVSSMLDKVVGAGNSAVQVTADLNFDQTTTHTTRYYTNPKAVPLTATSTTEKYKGPGTSATAGGVVGPDGQLTQSTVPGGATRYQKNQRTSDNAVDQVVQQVQAAPGNVKALHVGIVLDSTSPTGKNAAAVQKLVSSALGINPKRGDTVTVSSLPFDHTAQQQAAAELAAQQKAESQARWFSIAKTGGLLLVLALILFAAWRRSRKREQLREQATTYMVEQIRRQAEPVAAVPPAPAAPELPAADPAGELRVAARDEIAAMVERQPEEVAQLLRGWLVEAER
ncbi:MAG: flagellar basal-body MS-ring/collar protein FliF [Nocardioidaceae bacterium]